MAAQGKKKQKIKGTKMALTDFLADGSSNPAPAAKIDWATEMDNNDMEEADIDFISRIDRSKLPTAPKAARGPDVDMNKVPNEPPFTAFIGNLAYETTEENIVTFFKKLSVVNVRLPEDRGRLRGFGYVEFTDRQNLLDALNMNEEMMMGRKVRVDLADQHQQNDKRGSGFDRQQSGGDPDRTEGNWRSAPKNFDDFDRGPQRGGYDDRGPPRGGYDDRGPRGGYDDRGPPRGGRYDDRGPSRGYDDRRGGGYGRDRYEDRGPPRDRYDDRGPQRDRYDDRGPPRDRYDDRGPPRDRYDDRRGYNDRGGGGGYNRDRHDDRGPPRDRYDDRGPQRDRYDDRDGGRRQFGSGYNRDDRQDNYRNDRHSPPRDAPAERPRLNLKPRTKPPEETAPPEREKPQERKPSSNIFGNAKPVDTAAKEREIEERLRREREDEGRKKAEEEKENRNINTSPGYRPRRDSREDGRQRRLSSTGSGKGRPGPPPVTSPDRPRHDSDVSNHSQEVFSGGEDGKEEPRSPVSPSIREESAKLVPAPPPTVNVWEKRKETVVKTAVVSVKSPMESHTHVKSEVRSIADAPSSSSGSSSTSQSPENKAAPPPRENPWTKRQYNRETPSEEPSGPWGKPTGRAENPEPRGRGESSEGRGRGRGGRGGAPGSAGRGGRGGGPKSRPQQEKKIPKSIDEMPKYEAPSGKDFSQQNKFAGLLPDDDEES